jgi:8-oxo-dGTP pyrophosphatase MutT (NUDIX family)
MNTEDRFFATIAARKLVRPSVRAIVRSECGFLVQRPADEPTGHFAFIGGEYELGDTFEERIRREFEEETSAGVTGATYRFVVENRFFFQGSLIQTIEHYLEVELDRGDLRSREPHLTQHWLRSDAFAAADIRPRIVRDALLGEDWRSIRHLVVPLEA